MVELFPEGSLGRPGGGEEEEDFLHERNCGQSFLFSVNKSSIPVAVSPEEVLVKRQSMAAVGFLALHVAGVIWVCLRSATIGKKQDHPFMVVACHIDA